MSAVPQSLVGRARELSALHDALQAARAGQGALWFVAGEAGIGKSRLCEELARSALQAGMGVHWGRCWEAGGAPAFWPFIQVLRTVLAQAGPDLPQRLPPAHVQLLAGLLPELRTSSPEVVEHGLAPEQARFQMLDAIGALIGAASRSRPLLILLDDLHVADVATAELLEFLAGTVRGMPVCIVGALREAEAEARGAFTALGPVVARAHTLSLRRLDLQEVGAYLQSQLERPPEPDVLQAVFASTEGNPLFVVEAARLLSGSGTAQPGSVPGTVRRMIAAHLERLSEGTHALLGTASVMGREIDRALLAVLTGQPAAALAVPLSEAVDVAILVEDAPGHYRFSHILLREALYEALPESQRQTLHARLAQALQDHRPDALSEIAHHFLAAGTEGAAQAIDAMAAAARADEAQLAFADAAGRYQQALQHLGRVAPGDTARRIELLLGAARAQMLAGDLAGGEAACLQVAELARTTERPEALARAALSLGRMFTIAYVSPQLVSLLREALAALPPGDSALRARVMARLAAAEQPAPDPQPPMQMALAAIEMARRAGNRADLLASLRAGGSALADLCPPDQRQPLNREHEALGRALGQPAEAMRGAMRLSFDLFELGQVVAARQAIARCQGYASALDHPHYRWRFHALRAMSAIFDGQFEVAARETAQAQRLGQRAADPNLEVVLLSQQLAVARLRGDDVAARELARQVDQACEGSAIPPGVRAVTLLAELLRAGSPLPKSPVRPAQVDAVIATSDRTMLGALAEVVLAAEDRVLARRVLASLLPSRDHLLHGGMLGMTWDGPAALYIARLHALLNEPDAARAAFAHAVERMVSVGSAPHEAWVRHARVRFLLSTGGDASDDLSRCLRIAEEHDLPGLARRLSELSAAPANAEQGPGKPSALPPPLQAAPTLALRQEGDLWWLQAGAERFALKDTKGVRMLAQLLAEPGRSFHVLDLVTPGGGSDTGSAGELLDDEARQAYRRRMADLQDALQEAEAFQDLQRATRTREEIDALGAELARALGLGGRSRRAGAAVERARVNVQRRIKDAIARVAAHDAQLGKHLGWAIQTGTFCTYQPGG